MITIQLAENQKLDMEDRILRAQIQNLLRRIINLNRLIEFCETSIVSLKEKNEQFATQLQQQNEFLVEVTSDFLKEMLTSLGLLIRSERASDAVIDIQRKIIEAQRHRMYLMTHLLSSSLPKEKFSKAMELISILQKERCAEVQRKIEDAKAEITRAPTFLGKCLIAQG